MKSITSYFIFLGITLFLSACVSQQAYMELEEQKKYYQTEAEQVDSLRNANNELYAETRQSEAQLRKAYQELEQLTVTNESLHRNYQALMNQYNEVVNQNQDVLSSATYERQTLEEQLANKVAELDQRERVLQNLEYELRDREQRLNIIESNYANLEGDIVERNKRIQELEAMVSLAEGSMAQLRERINEALREFTAADLTVSERKGRLYVTLSQDLLFKSGSNAIDWKGKQAIGQVASVLNQNPDISIMVEGHTDTDGTASQNWDLSVLRATAVTKVLTDNGVDPKRIIPSGRAFYDPVAPNTTAAGKAQNRRTEIILSPNLDKIYDLLNAGTANQ